MGVHDTENARLNVDSGLHGDNLGQAGVAWLGAFTALRVEEGQNAPVADDAAYM